MLSALLQQLKAILGFKPKSNPEPKSNTEQKQKRKKSAYMPGIGFNPVNRRINYLKGNGRKVLLINNRCAKNPTYQELVDFLKVDETEKIEYKPNRFVCADFAQLLHNRAEKYGIRAAWVAVRFKNGDLHACNAFRTIDKGLVFIDCTNSQLHFDGIGYDSTVIVRNNHEYKPTEITDGWQYDLMGITEKYQLYW